MTARREPSTFSIRLGEVSGAVADLGVLVPLAAALILVNGLDPGGVLLAAGLLVVVSGAAFRIPFPVQPLKALTAVAVAQQLSPGVIHAAGLEIAAFLLLLSFKGVADAVARLFVKPVIRALQLRVGILLLVTAIRLVRFPPEVFSGTPASPWPVALAGAAVVAVWFAARVRRYGLAVALVAAGVLATWVAVRPALGGPSFHMPEFDLPAARDFATAFLLLVVPQLPLTFGNAVVAVSDLAREYFGAAGRRVTPSRVCLSCGIGNVTSALIGGMPMCHGAGGLTAHVRLGARTAGMNLLLGGALITVGLLFADQVTVLFGLLPVWVLGAFLAYAAVRHALLVLDLRGWELAVAVVAGAIGAWSGNLAITTGVALLGTFLLKARRRSGRGELIRT